MKREILLSALLVVFLISCGSKEREEVEQTHPNGKPKKVNYFKGGRKPYRVVFYFENGKVQSDQYFDSKTGEPDSIKVIYYPNGQKYKETFYKKGKLNGPDKSWYENGTLKSEASYVDDVPQGTSIIYHPNGK
ncbi:MAG: hypothetical protein N2053_13165, partial [Chitinispirillaceae bacterium]|nr:hypothetical protein [Chitinispirillaceae bacterium]